MNDKELNLTISPFTVSDLDGVLAAEGVCFTRPWTRGDFETALELDGYAGFVAHKDGALAGYAFLLLVGGEAELANLATLPEHRGKGVAKALLTHALDRCRESGAERCFLEVRESNAAARGLYASFGFEEVAVRKKYYDYPTEDAVIMKKELAE